MRIEHIAVENFRALKDVALPLGPFACVIGENNVGKSSLLHAVLRFCDGQKLPPTDFYDPSQPVRVTVELEMTEDSLGALSEEHRDRIAELVTDSRLKLTRFFARPGAKSELRCNQRVPSESRWRAEEVKEKVKGLKAADLTELAKTDYPEIVGDLSTKPTQKEFVAKAGGFARTIPDTAKEEVEGPLPTGFDNSIAAILPEPIYIEAVKDLAGVMRTADAATFGKILGLLLNVVQPQLNEEKQLFEQLYRKLNVITGEDGEKVDDRIAEVRELEQLVQGHLNENFPEAQVNVEVPSPEIKSILQGAKLRLHDGAVEGPVETVGDGLKRSVMFSLFRTYAELAGRAKWSSKAAKADAAARTIVLYEEPELYLHPKAQQVLFEALALMSKSLQVVVTTHSPLFFSGKRTSTFSKMTKASPSGSGETPHSTVKSVDLAGDLSLRESLLLLCYENNNVAFFADRVLLVEGDSDTTVFRHLAALLNEEWDFDRGRVRIVRVGGKGNFDRFRSFFRNFGIESLTLADLDVLVDGFDKVGLDAASLLPAERNALVEETRKLAKPETPKTKTFKSKLNSWTWRERANRFYEVARSVAGGATPSDEDLALVSGILEDEFKEPTLELLRTSLDIRDRKLDLLAGLRENGILILEKGCLEDYYPPDIEGGDKYTKAEAFTKSVTSREAAIALFAEVPVHGGGTKVEIEAMLERVFGA